MITEVVAALIRRGDKFLICKRPAGKARAGLWEFVGGKTEAGEGKEHALMRECMEELAIDVSVGEVYAETTYVYPDLTVHLTLFCCTIERGEPQLLEHSELKWISPEETDGYEFCPADVEILKKLRMEARE